MLSSTRMSKHKYLLGELEQAIMDVVWRRPSVTVRDVVEHLHGRRLKYTTVMTVMNRLTSHRVLTKQESQSGAFVYQARLTRDAWGAAASKFAIDDIVRRYGAVAMAQFVDRLDRVPNEKLAELRRRLRHSEK